MGYVGLRKCRGRGKRRQIHQKSRTIDDIAIGIQRAIGGIVVRQRVIDGCPRMIHLGFDGVQVRVFELVVMQIH